MAIDVDTRGSDGWWMKQLAQRLHDRWVGKGWNLSAIRQTYDVRPGLEILNSYLTGNPPLPTAAHAWRGGVFEFLRLSRMNYAELVVSAAKDRMLPLGWRTAADDDRDGDSLAAEVAARNRFDISTGDVFTGMLTAGDAYMIVGEPHPGTNVPVITAEDARDVITAHDPRTGAVVAALKMYRDDWDAADFAHLYLPGRIAVAIRRTRTGTGSGPPRFSPGSFSWDDDQSGKVPGMDGRVPVARFRNRRGTGEYEPHLDVLNRINDRLFEQIAIAKFQAFRQRALRGLAKVDDRGEEIDYSESFLADPGSLWQLPAGVEVWESQLVDLTPLRMAVKDDVQALAAVTATPLHYITPDAASGSAEGASLMREGHVYRVEDRRRRAGAALADVLSLAFAAMGDKQRADAYRISTIWQAAERYSLSERMSAASQAKVAGLPQSSIFTDVLQYAPADLTRLERERATDLLFLSPEPVPPSAR